MTLVKTVMWYWCDLVTLVWCCDIDVVVWHWCGQWYDIAVDSGVTLTSVTYGVALVWSSDVTLMWWCDIGVDIV